MAKRILVIDDDKLVLKSIKQLLERAKYDVSCVSSGKDAVSAVDQGKFDLVISDVRMPEQDGVSVIKTIKEKIKAKGLPEVPFIFMTGYASEDVPIDAVKMGAKDYILKPFDLDELLKSVQENTQ